MTYQTSETDVLIVGAGPAGLMLACVLTRFGIKVKIIDERPTETSQGKADGLQPKTLETFTQLGLLDQISSKCVRIYDITFWKQKDNGEYYRAQREVHFPPVVDLRRPYILLTHQGVVERMFIDDIARRDVKVDRNTKFVGYEIVEGGCVSTIVSDGIECTVRSKYLVGADGAHSSVRRAMGAKMVGESTDSCWGVIDGELDTDFPDIWNKTVINSNEHGSVLGIPRERNLTRLYIELQRDLANDLTEENKKFVQETAQRVVSPFKLEWRSVEWFGIYKVGQRVANAFSDQERVFIVGDASHTHSPKAAQGMNVSMHDSWNLGWKLAMVLKGLAKDNLLTSYELERKKIGQDLIDFDKEHAKAFDVGDQEELAKNFAKNVSFISGLGAEYDTNSVNRSGGVGSLQPGRLPVPANVIRFVDSNPVPLETDIPVLGQFTVHFFVPNLGSSFLADFSEAIAPLAKKLALHPPLLECLELDSINKRRYTPLSELLTVSVVTKSTPDEFAIAALPSFFRPYKWTVYQDTEGGAFSKWVPESNSIAIFRPDGYVATAQQFSSGIEAASWFSDYFSSL